MFLKENYLLTPASKITEVSDIRNCRMRVKNLDENLEENSEDVRHNHASKTQLAGQEMIINMKTLMKESKKLFKRVGSESKHFRNSIPIEIET